MNEYSHLFLRSVTRNVALHYAYFKLKITLINTKFYESTNVFNYYLNILPNMLSKTMNLDPLARIRDRTINKSTLINTQYITTIATFFIYSTLITAIGVAGLYCWPNERTLPGAGKY